MAVDPPGPALPSVLFAAVAMRAFVMSKPVKIGLVLEERLVDRIERAQGAFPSRYPKQFFLCIITHFGGGAYIAGTYATSCAILVMQFRLRDIWPNPTPLQRYNS